ncbi:Methyltransferase-like protein 21D [Blyttiomyces sp. JEL0837]|nr:Methyltransferase-like protein 21D [Blyttiomyces sp. JEL0837]
MTSTSLHPYEYEFNDESILTILQDTGTTTAGHGLTLWDASLIASKYLERHALKYFSNPQRIIELGSGTGILGLVAAKLISSQSKSKSSTTESTLVLTDLPDVIPLLQKNVDAFHNENTDGLKIKVSPLTWGGPNLESEIGGLTDPSTTTTSNQHTFDLILLSDCVYEPTQFQSLVSTMAKLSHKETKVLLCYERRNFDEEVVFFKMFGEKFRFWDVKPEMMDERFVAEDIYLFEGVWRT